MKNKILFYLLAYGTWVVFILLGIVFILLSRSTLQFLLQRYYAQGDYMPTMRAQLIDRVYVMVIGFIWLVLMILVEQYFSRGVANGKIMVRLSRVLGPEVFLLSMVQLGYLFLNRMAYLSWLTGALMAIEIGFGLILMWYGFSRKDTPPRPSARV